MSLNSLLISSRTRIAKWARNISVWPGRTEKHHSARSRYNDRSLSETEPLESRIVPTSVALHVVGNQLENPSGQPVVLRGVNVDGQEGWGKAGGGLYYDSYTQAAVQQGVTTALNWNANLIRLPVNQDFWLGLDPGVNKTSYIADIDALIRQVSNAGGYVMLVAKVTDGGTGNPLLESGNYSLPDNNTTAFWKSVSQHYANNPAVMFDLFNEPGHWNATYAQWRNGSTRFSENVDGHNVSYASPGLEGLIQAIRTVPGGNHTIIAAEAMNYAHDFSSISTAITQGNGLTDTANQLIYSVHIYPNTVSDSSVVANLNNLLPASVTDHYPLYVGEWGADINPGLEGAVARTTTVTAWNQNLLKWLSTKPYSWTAWAINAEPWLTYHATNSPTSYFGQLVKTDLASHHGISSVNASVQFQDTDDWGSGFVGYITITNTGSTPIIGWSLQFDFTGVISPNPDPKRLTNIWNATWVSHTGNHYVLQNDSTDLTIAPGQSIRFGFVATWANPHSAPKNFVLNGVAIS